MPEGTAKTPETKKAKTDTGVKKGQDTGKKGLDGGRPKTPEGGPKTGGQSPTPVDPEGRSPGGVLFCIDNPNPC